MKFDNSIVLRHQDLELSKIKLRDHKRYLQIRERNREWLQPWDATLPKVGDRYEEPITDPASSTAFFSLYFAATKANRNGSALTLAMRKRGRMIGLITASNINYGAARNTQIGYWIDQRYAGNSYTPKAVAMLIDYLILIRKLHRVEIAIRPENSASLRVVEKLKLRSEGERPRYLHIDNAWRDHLIFAIDSSEIETGLVAKLFS